MKVYFDYDDQFSRDLITLVRGLARPGLEPDRMGDALETAFIMGALFQEVVFSSTRRAGGLARAAELRRNSAAADAMLRRLAGRFDISDELKEQHRTLISYLAGAMRQHPKTVRRRLRRLNLPIPPKR